MGAISSDARRRSLVGMLSGPDALLALRFFKSLVTPGVVMEIGGINRVVLVPRFGKLLWSSLL